MRKLTCPRGWQTLVNKSLPGLSPRLNTKNRFTKYFYCNVVIAPPILQGISFCSQADWLNSSFLFVAKNHARRGGPPFLCCSSNKTMTHVATNNNEGLIQDCLPISLIWFTKCTSPQACMNHSISTMVDRWRCLQLVPASSLRGC